MSGGRSKSYCVIISADRAFLGLYGRRGTGYGRDIHKFVCVIVSRASDVGYGFALITAVTLAFCGLCAILAGGVVIGYVIFKDMLNGKTVRRIADDAYFQKTAFFFTAGVRAASGTDLDPGVLFVTARI